ncbi:MAG: hypothetical protein JOS17DRAFT_780808 [Linnemannia elongata]|nr:MAG: hypothetical protein JOS17DRAFT_780808 [Linnemannia elongata]
MLYRPTRREVTDWIDPYNNEASKYSSMARDYFGVNRLRELAPALATLFEALGEQMIPAPGELSMADLCATAPQLNDLLPTQKDLVLDLLADYQFDFLEKQILITGSSGSGKSYVLRFFMRYFYEQPDCEPVLLAPSGVAANNISGHTIHRFFNIPRTESSGEQPDCDPVRLALRIRQLKAQGKRPCLLIDEVSMVSRVRFHDDLRFIDLPERVDNHPADFASVHVPSDVRIHVTKELEDLYWRPAALTQIPGAIDPTISQAPSASQEPFDQDLEDEFYLAEEDGKDFFAEYDNDDFFLEKEEEEENVLQDLEEVEEEEEEEEVLQRTYHFPRKQ